MTARPHDFGGEHCGIPVSMTVLDELRDNLPISREEAFRWVDREFELAAEDVYRKVGSPTLTLQTGWDVFARMAPLLSIDVATD